MLAPENEIIMCWDDDLLNSDSDFLRKRNQLQSAGIDIEVL